MHVFLSKARSVPGRPPAALSLLPPPREPLQLRFGEQNLHIPAAGFRPPCRSAALSLCSPLPANPCSSVPGSKIFTFPPPDFVLPAARRPPLFAPRSPRTLMAPFRGAKSSHFRRRISSSQAHGGFPSLLPALREPLWLRSGEQNLHIPAAGARPDMPAPLPTIGATRKTGGSNWGYKPPLLTRASRRGFSLCSSLSVIATLAAPKGAYLTNGSSYSFTLSLSTAISCFSWSLIYFLIVSSLRPTVLT